jgi:hypothetical protein
MTDNHIHSADSSELSRYLLFWGVTPSILNINLYSFSFSMSHSVFSDFYLPRPRNETTGALPTNRN